MLKNVAGQKITVLAWDTAADEPKTGDAAQITAYISKDGGAPAQTDDVNPTELDATNMSGLYQFDMTQPESTCDLLDLLAKSSTANIKLDPVSIYTIDPASYKADVSGLATSAALATHDGNLATHDGNLAAVAAVVALEATAQAIKAKTDNLPADPAGVSDLAALALEATAQAIKAKTDNLPADPAGVSDLAALALEATAQAIKAKTDNLPGDPAGISDLAALALEATAQAIKAKTDNLPASPAATGAEMALTAAALTAIADEIRDSKWTAGGVASVGFLLRCVNSMAKGNFYRDDNVYRFYDDDDTGSEDGTLLFTLTITVDGERRNS